MTGATAELGSLAMLARAHNALLYLDDEAGFGVIGERGPDELCAYGKRGNATVRHFGESYDNIVLVAGFSKAYSSLLTFLALPTRLKQALRAAAPVRPHPTPTALAAVATVLEGLAINERRGDALRLELHRMTTRVLDALAAIGVPGANATGYPIVEAAARRARRDGVGRTVPVRQRHLRDAGDPADRPARRGRHPHPADLGEHRRPGAHLIEVLTAVAERFRIAGQDPEAARDAVSRGLAQLVAA